MTTLAPQLKSFRPTGKRVMFRRHPDATHAGVIELPWNSMTVAMRLAEVVAVAEGVENVKGVEHVKVGDTILIHAQMSYPTFELNGETMRLIREDEIPAVVSR